MKVVINTCFGGFGLSVEAIKRLIDLKSPVIDAKAESDYGGKNYNFFKDERDFKNVGDGYFSSSFGSTLYKDGVVYCYKYDSVHRNDENLIKVVEEMGKAANGKFAQLAIVEIPDGVCWEIDEYDGNESVEECHRSWG